MPDDEVDKITHLNAIRHFSYDPFAHIPRNEATVSALRANATGWDVSIKSVRHSAPDRSVGPRVLMKLRDKVVVITGSGGGSR